MEHTKGKWSVGVYETTSTMIQRLTAKPQSCVCLEENGEPGMVIALCGDADDAQSQRDADLIAAAPEMLEALQSVWEFLEVNCLGQGELQAKVYDALIKAEGSK